MAKNPKVFLPRNLNPQGFLTDILLSQVYNPNFKGVGGDSLFDYLYSGKYNESIMSIPAWFGNRFEHEMRTARRTRSSKAKTEASIFDIERAYIEFLTSLTPAQISALVPYIRIFKKYKPVNSLKWNEEDMIFSNYANTNFYEATGRRLNSFANIERVRVEKNLKRFGVVNDYKISIDFIFSDFDMLTSGLPKEFGDSGDVSYLDLIRNNLNPGPKPKDSSNCFKHTGGKISAARPEFKYFEQLYIEYGWSGDAIGSGASTFSELLKPSQKAFVYKFLKEEKKVLRMNYFRHNIALDQDGLLRLSVDYTAYPEYARDDDNRDVGVIRGSSKKVVKEICKEETVLDRKLKELTSSRKALDIALSGGEKDTTKDQEAKIKKLNTTYVKAKEELAIYYQDVLLRKISRDENLFYLIYKSSDTQLKKEVVRGRKRKKYLNEITKELKFPGVNLLLGKVDLDLKTKPSADLKKDRFVYTEDGVPKAKDLIKQGKIGDKILKSVDGKKSPKDIEVAVDGVVKALLFTPGGAKHPLSGIGHYSFFPLKALISALYELYQGSCFQPPPILLGNTVVSCFGQEFWANIGDILVETGTFQRWLYETIFVKGNHDISYGNFMASIMTDLVPECIYLNSTTGVDKISYGNIIQTPKYVPEHFYKQKIKVGNDTISLSEWQKRLDDAAKKEASNGFPPTADLFYSLVKEFNADPEKGSTKEPFFFYHLKPIPQAALAKQELISPIFIGKDLMKRTYRRREDHKDGMIHLFVDEDRGLVIDASLSHNDLTKLRSALLFENQKDHGNPILKMTYSADITLIGNNIFEDSGIFVLPERQFKVAAERDELGVIGYYQINKMVDEIESGRYETKVAGMNLAPYTFAKDTINESKKTAPNASSKAVKEGLDSSVQSKNEKKSSISKKGINISFADYVADVLAMKDISKVYEVTAKDSVADKTEKAKE